MFTPAPEITNNPVTSGKLEKMQIISYTDAAFTQNKKSLEVLINPESLNFDYKLKVGNTLPPGTEGTDLIYLYTPPQEMTFEFLFDSTGIIDGAKRDDISKDILDFKSHTFDLIGEGHQPPYVMLAWGSETGFFKGRLIAMSINYKLFAPSGAPLRAIIKATFKASIEDEERVAKENKKSPDLTHVRIVKAGDTLPLMCNQIYNDPKYYLQIAQINRLQNFRKIAPGTEILFPPIDKKK